MPSSLWEDPNISTWPVYWSHDSLRSVLGAGDIDVTAKAFGLATTAQPLSKNRTAPQVPPLGDTRHVHPLEERERLTHNARVSGTLYLKSGKKLWPLSERPVPKHVRIRFEVSTNTPQPYIVKWQVVNTGEEAAQQLRGDFYKGDTSDGNVKWEPTAFLGTHWVEALLIKNGECVARSGRKYVKVR